ncbi:L,D-transpeptidase family protein [Candidatus Parcubacteria bacterium]|nr:L,D-transpeptidase family protein [Candidatus Parcubacteria bacterium]
MSNLLSGNEYGEPLNKRDDILHIHFLNRHIPTWFSYAFLIIVTIFVVLLLLLFIGKKEVRNIVIADANGERQDEFIYGSWPALENEDFFKKTKNKFISQNADFLEVDLSDMVIRYYEDGQLKIEKTVLHKGKEGSWWETPAGLYNIKYKTKNHFSSFGQVNMPYSMQFQGNFFIHGPTTYPDGTPTSSDYSGGCIRVALEDLKEIYAEVDVGTPLLVFEDSFNGNYEKKDYGNKFPVSEGASYIVADLENNFVFAEKNSEEIKSIASITKLMTALIAVEYINIEKDVVVDESMLATTSIPRLKVNDSFKVIDLLSLLLLESSNEAALAIANPLGKTVFLDLMNKKAKAIGMNKTKFADTNGVLSENKSTAQDLFYLAKYLYHNRSFILHMSMGNENRIAYGTPAFYDLNNLNEISELSDEIGGKIGISSSALETMLLVTNVQIDNESRPIAIVVLGSIDVKKDIVEIVNYIQNNFEFN